MKIFIDVEDGMIGVKDCEFVAAEMLEEIKTLLESASLIVNQIKEIPDANIRHTDISPTIKETTIRFT